MKHHDMLLVSWECENKWLALSHDILAKYGTLPVSAFIAELAFLCDISVLTSKRYLEKHSCMSGSLYVERGHVSLKHNPQAPDESF